MAIYTLMDGVSGRPGVGSSGTQPPGAATAFTGNYIAGLVFKVTQGGIWLSGYRWWVPGTNGYTTPQKFALWCIPNTATATLVPGGTVTSGTLTAGAFNYVALPTPLLLSVNVPYLAATGFATVSPQGFPDTQNQFGVGQPYASGITNGPLTAYPGNNSPDTFNWPQQPFSTTGTADPSVTAPATNDLNDLLWLDVQVTDQAPQGNVSWRAWPNVPAVHVVTSNDLTGYTLGFQFSLSQSCTLGKIWHYSVPSASTVLPTRCLIWNVGTQTAVPGTDNLSPSWKNSSGAAAAAGDGWVYCDYSGAGVTLASSVQYKVSTFHAAGSAWFGATADTFGPGELWGSGFTHGPLIIPGNSGASPGQQSWNTTTFAYPNTSTNPEVDWIDVEVTPLAAGGLLLATFP